MLSILPRISDLGVANTVSLTRLLRYDAKDTFLLAAIDKINDLDLAKVDSLVAAAYDKKEEIRRKALGRLSAS